MSVDHVPPFVACLESLWGLAVCTPEQIWDGEKLVPATYRVFRWDCPVCRAGESDPRGIFKPFSVDDLGHQRCVMGCPEWMILEAIQLDRDVQKLLDSMGGAL